MEYHRIFPISLNQDNVLSIQEAEIPELDPEIVERLIQRPEDLPTHAKEHIKKYKTNMLRILEVSGNQVLFTLQVIIIAARIVTVRIGSNMIKSWTQKSHTRFLEPF